MVIINMLLHVYSYFYIFWSGHEYRQGEVCIRE